MRSNVYFSTTLLLAALPLSQSANCSVFGIDMHEVVEDTCFTVNKLSPPLFLKWTVPVCPVQENCTAVAAVIERNGKPIGKYDGQWKLLPYGGFHVLGVNYTRPDGLVVASILFRCDPYVQSPLISNVTVISTKDRSSLYVITVSHKILCEHPYLQAPLSDITYSPTNVHTSFPTPLGRFYYVTNFDCNITWSSDELKEDFPDYPLIIDSLEDMFHIIITNALPPNIKDHVLIRIAENDYAKNTFQVDVKRFDSTLPWVLRATVQSSEESTVFKIEKELRKLHKNNGELIGMLLERGINYIEAVDVVNITSTTTSVDVLSEISKHSPARILWIILGTICVFAIIVMSIQKLIEYFDDPANFDRISSCFRILYSRVTTRFAKIRHSSVHDETEDDDSESGALDNGFERRALLQQRK